MADKFIVSKDDTGLVERYRDMGDGSFVRVSAGAPVIGTPIQNSSGNVAAASAVATLAAAAGKTTYITGFDVTGGGAVAALLAQLTVSGLLGGTATYILGVLAGVALANPPLSVRFNPPLPASALNTPIVVTVPSLGTGNTNSCVVAYGFQV